MQSIAVFNNKGGVGKTTLLCNLAAYLAIKKGFRVLIVDADPQCNATQNLFDDNTITDLYSLHNFTIYNVVKPLSSGKGYSSTLKTKQSHAFGVDVIPGDPKLALTEDLLATDWGHAVSGNTRGLRTTFLFSHLLSLCNDYDYVIFDMGPSLGSINRSVLLAVDFFVTPMSIDIFSLRAIENISLSLMKWKKQLQTGLDLNDEPEELEVDDMTWRLQFAGYVTQQYTAKKDAQGTSRAVKAFDKIMKRIPDVIDNEFIETFQKEQSGLDYYLGSIPTLHSLIPLSQTSRRPIFKLRAADGVVGAHFAKVSEYESIIAGIAAHLIKNLQALS